MNVTWLQNGLAAGVSQYSTAVVVLVLVEVDMLVLVLVEVDVLVLVLVLVGVEVVVSSFFTRTTCLRSFSALMNGGHDFAFHTKVANNTRPRNNLKVLLKKGILITKNDWNCHTVTLHFFLSHLQAIRTASKLLKPGTR